MPAPPSPDSATDGAAESRAIRVGVDLVEVGRLTRLLGEQPAIVATLFTERELAYCDGRTRRRNEHLAGRFAAKEAVLKAFGTGLGTRMRWTDVEIVHDAGGRPRVQLHGEVSELGRRRGVTAVDVSLSHTAGFALANAIVCFRTQPSAAVGS